MFVVFLNLKIEMANLSLFVPVLLLAAFVRDGKCFVSRFTQNAITFLLLQVIYEVCYCEVLVPALSFYGRNVNNGFMFCY